MPGLKPTQEDVEQFVAITQASHEDALHFLEAGTTLEGAIEDFYATQTAAAPAHPTRDEDDDEAIDDFIDDDTNMADDRSQQPPAAGGVRNLNGELVNDTLPAGWGKPQKKFGRIGESDSGPSGGGGESNDDDEPEEFYAGGQSGLAVQNPDQQPRQGNSIVDNILRMAGRNSAPPPPAGQAARQVSSGTPSVFRGTGHTLGSDEAPSSEVPAAGSQFAAGPGVAAVTPNMMDQLLAGMLGGRGGGAAGARPSAAAQFEDDEEDEDDENEDSVQTRRLTFWRNGFSIEDGPLMAYDDPENQRLLAAIEGGRAPPNVFGVRYDQRLNVEVAQRRKEDYQPPPKKPAQPFGGSGNRLGSVTPEVQGSPGAVPGGFPQGILAGGSSSSGAAIPSGASAGASAKFEVDESKPTTNVQLRLGDGTRLVAKVNLSHTVDDLRNYVSLARPSSRPFVLQTTFPSRELSDPSETIEAAKLQNAVVVQRYT
ncbi:hypothetical protein IAR55_007144 [Kwoniella newhampshirensis]|uniref:UBX domain-containing protein 1 n=1 Tax=Kwoniella newhampshirensis TaxID=1651941 RepID=A0AAW0YTH3_9TREE